MRITIQMELKLTGPLHKYMHVMNTIVWPLKIISLCGRSIVCYVNCG